MKYTLLPPQKAPKQQTAHRGIPNLGEHKQAFMNLHNQHGWIQEETPEKPQSDEMMALVAMLLSSNRRVNKPKRDKAIKTNQLAQQMVRGNSVDINSDIFKQDINTLMKKQMDEFVGPRSPVSLRLEITPGSPMDEYVKAVTKARAEGRLYSYYTDAPFNDAEYLARRNQWVNSGNTWYSPDEIRAMLDKFATDFEGHPGVFRKHIVQTRTHFSYKAAKTEDLK